MTAPPATVVWRSISPKYFWLRLAVLAAWTLVSVVAAIVAAVLVSGWFLLAAFAVSVLGVLRAVFVRRSVRAWGYAERAEDLLVRHGLLVRRLSIVPYARMQFVDVTAGPLERAAGGGPRPPPRGAGWVLSIRSWPQLSSVRRSRRTSTSRWARSATSPA